MIKILINFIFAPAVFCCVTLSVLSQTKIDEFGYTNADSGMARIDNFLLALQNAPDARGFIIVYGPKTTRKGEIEAHIRQMPKYLNFRYFDSSRITFINGGYKDSDRVTVTFWTAAPGESAPEPSDILDIKEVKFLKGRFRWKHSLYWE